MRLSSLLRSVLTAAKNPRSIPIHGKDERKSCNIGFLLIVFLYFSEATLAQSDSVLVLSLLLPSRQETCRFHLNLQTATVGKLIDDIKGEDAGVEQVHVYDANGNQLSQSYSINSLMQSSFTIQLNQQKTFLFDAVNKLQIRESNIQSTTTSKFDGPSTEDTVAAVYHALNVMKVYHTKYHELKHEANQLTAQLEPLEKVKARENSSKNHFSFD